jgi:hypothetical protein
MENNSSPRSQAQSLLFIAFLVKISAMIRSMIIEMTVIKIQFFMFKPDTASRCQPRVTIWRDEE